MALALDRPQREGLPLLLRFQETPHVPDTPYWTEGCSFDAGIMGFRPIEGDMVSFTQNPTSTVTSNANNDGGTPDDNPDDPSGD